MTDYIKIMDIHLMKKSLNNVNRHMTDERKYFYWLKTDASIQNSQHIRGISKINNERTGNLARKLDKHVNWQYEEAVFQQASKHMKIYSNSFVFTEMHIKTMRGMKEVTSQ